MERGEGSSKNNGKSSSEGNNGKGNSNRLKHVPGATVLRIMKRILPPDAQITDEAKKLVQECVSEFIGFVTTEANDNCISKARKTVTADDILLAMENFGFDDYVPPLAILLNTKREIEGSNRGPFVPNFVGLTSAQGAEPGHSPDDPILIESDDGGDDGSDDDVDTEGSSTRDVMRGFYSNGK